MMKRVRKVPLLLAAFCMINLIDSDLWAQATDINFGLAVGGKISGIVTQDSDGQPVSGLTVKADDISAVFFTYSAETQDDGSYTITGLPSGSYRVLVDASDTEYAEEYYNNAYDSQSATPVSVTLGQTTANIDFGLAVGGKITGVVTQDVGGLPLIGQMVYAFVYNNSTVSWEGLAITGLDGSYTIAGLSPGNYKVRADDWSQIYAGEYYNNTYDTNAAAPVSVALGQTAANINFGLAIGGEIKGVVTEDSNGQPISNLQVSANPYDDLIPFWGGSATTQADGSYTIAGLSPVRQRVKVNTYGTDYAEEYYNNTYDYDSATPVNVKLDQPIENINFGLAIGGKITGVVTRASNSQPIPDIMIIAGADNASSGSWNGFALTHADGSYTINGLPTGSYFVQVWNTAGMDYAREYYNNTYDPNSATPVSVTQGQTTANIDFDLAAGGKITGKVTRDSDGQPLSGLDVLAGPFDLSTGFWYGDTETQANGSYTITGLSPGRYMVRVDASDTDYAGEYYNNTYDYNSATPVDVTLGSVAGFLSPGIIILLLGN